MKQSDFDLLTSTVKETRRAVEAQHRLTVTLCTLVAELCDAVKDLTAKGPKVRYKKFVYEPLKDKKI